MHLSRKTQLALEAVIDIAYNARPDPVQSKEITERQGIPQRYLEQVMQQLVRAGVLKGVRGPRGGYRLARERRRISVGDIVRIVSALENGEEAREEPVSDLSRVVVRPMVERIHDELMEKLDAMSVEDLVREAERTGVMGDKAQGADFTI